VKSLARLLLTGVIFIAGALMTLDALNGAAFQALNSQPLTWLWWLIPGVILLIISYPLLHYYYDKWKRSYNGSREQEALDVAKREMMIKEQVNGKK
jgi:heme/copper-type cytochrome/quinol oxidase subunit 2